MNAYKFVPTLALAVEPKRTEQELQQTRADAHIVFFLAG